MIIGEDTYVSLEEANTYITNHYVSTDPLRIAWQELSNDDKNIYIKNATISIDSLILAGKKADPEQKLQFPRCYDTKRKSTIYSIGGKYCQEEVPTEVKYAQIEVAIFNCDKKANSRLVLQSEGVKSFSLGDLSESYEKVRGSSTPENILKSQKAVKLMRAYIGGSFNVV